MTSENLAAVWFIVGIIYAIINGAVRKIDTDGDWLLPFAWVTMWPFMLPAVIVSGVYRKLKNRN